MSYRLRTNEKSVYNTNYMKYLTVFSKIFSNCCKVQGIF